MSNSIHPSREPQKHRCVKCGKLLANDTGLAYEIKCLRCGTINAIFSEFQEQVIITNTKGVVLYTNEATEVITGYKPEEIIGKTPAVWGGMMSKEYYQEFWRLLLVEKRSIIAHLKNRHKSGTLYDAVLRVTPIVNTLGKIEFLIGMESKLKLKLSDQDDWSLPKIIGGEI